MSVSVYTFAAPFVGGTLLGLSVLGGVLSFPLAILSAGALTLSARSSHCTVTAHLIYGSLAGTIGGAWVPQALRTLGATPVESQLGLAAAVMWSAIPGFVLLGIVARVTKNMNDSGGFAVYCLALFAVETALVSLPGTVPWILFGYAASGQLGVAQLAAVGGVPLVSAALAAAAFALIRLIESLRGDPRSQNIRLPISFLSGFACLALFGADFAHNASRATPVDGHSVRFVAIQPAIPRPERLRPTLQSLNTDRLVQYSTYELEALEPSEHDTFVVWPENALIDTGDTLISADELARAAAVSIGRPLILSATRPTIGQPVTELRNSLISLDSHGRIVAAADKFRAVPAVEATNNGWIESVARSLIGEAGRGRRIETSPSLVPLESAGGASIALCFEVLFPNIVSGRRPENATAILNLADDSWVSSPLASRQLTSIARFRAIEQRLPLVRVAHGGLSAAFDAFGRPITELPLDRYGSIVIEAFPARKPSWFSRSLILALPLGSGLSVWWSYPLVARLIFARRIAKKPTDHNVTAGLLEKDH